MQINLCLPQPFLGLHHCQIIHQRYFFLKYIILDVLFLLLFYQKIIWFSLHYERMKQVAHARQSQLSSSCRLSVDLLLREPVLLPLASTHLLLVVVVAAAATHFNTMKSMHSLIAPSECHARSFVLLYCCADPRARIIRIRRRGKSPAGPPSSNCLGVHAHRFAVCSCATQRPTPSPWLCSFVAVWVRRGRVLILRARLTARRVSVFSELTIMTGLW